MPEAAGWPRIEDTQYTCARHVDIDAHVMHDMRAANLGFAAERYHQHS